MRGLGDMSFDGRTDGHNGNSMLHQNGFVEYKTVSKFKMKQKGTICFNILLNLVLFIYLGGGIQRCKVGFTFDLQT
jgi:hypothetical protein